MRATREEGARMSDARPLLIVMVAAMWTAESAAQRPQAAGERDASAGSLIDLAGAFPDTSIVLDHER